MQTVESLIFKTSKQISSILIFFRTEKQVFLLIQKKLSEWAKPCFKINIFDWEKKNFQKKISPNIHLIL